MSVITIEQAKSITSELVYDSATSLGHPPFCNWRVSPSSERLHSQIWLHQLDNISLSIMCLGAIICDKNTIGFVSVYAWSLWRFGYKLCNRSLDDSTVHETKWTSTFNQGMTWLIYTSSDHINNRHSNTASTAIRTMKRRQWKASSSSQTGDGE